MKTFSHLWLDDNGLKAFNAPEKPSSSYTLVDSTSYIHTQWYKETGGYKDPNEWYQQRLQQALAEGVYFNDVAIKPSADILLWYVMFSNIEYMMLIEKHKPYPVPDGYEILTQCDKYPCDGKNCQLYAILVPKEFQSEEEKQKAIKKEFEWLTPEKAERLTKPANWNKQQSIEEAAELYELPYKREQNLEGVNINTSQLKHAFIAGAKSQAAEKYWFEQFKREQQ